MWNSLSILILSLNINDFLMYKIYAVLGRNPFFFLSFFFVYFLFLKSIRLVPDHAFATEVLEGETRDFAYAIGNARIFFGLPT